MKKFISKLFKGIILKPQIRHLIKTIRHAGTKLIGFEDYYSFPFIVNKPIGSNIEKEFSKIIKNLNSNNIEYYLAEGVLLGLFRDGKFIKHDTDIDFYLIEQKEIKRVIKIMINLDFEIGRIVNFKKKLRQITFYNKHELVIDFCYWDYNKKHKEYYLHLPEIYPKKLKLDADLFKSKTQLQFNNYSILTFNDIQKYLKTIYGETWKIPQIKKNDWKKEYQNFK